MDDAHQPPGDGRAPPAGAAGRANRRSGSGDDLVAQLTRWLAEQRVDAGADARTRERWLVHQAREEGSFAGVLLSLAERERPVLIHAAGGRLHRGVVRAVAGDFLALRTEGHADVLLCYAGITSIRPQPRSPLVAGDRTITLDTTLAHALLGLAGERPRVLVVALDGEGVAGELRAVGRDVVTLRLDGEGRPTVYLPLASVAEVSLNG